MLGVVGYDGFRVQNVCMSHGGNKQTYLKTNSVLSKANHCLGHCVLLIIPFKVKSLKSFSSSFS